MESCSPFHVDGCGYIIYSCTAVQQQQKQGQSLRLGPYVHHHTRGGSIVVLPAADPKGPPETCGSLTLARPCVAVALRSGPGAVQQHASRRHRVTFFLKKEVAEIVFQNAAIGIVVFLHDEALFPYCGLAGSFL